MQGLFLGRMATPNSAAATQKLPEDVSKKKINFRRLIRDLRVTGKYHQNIF